MKLKPREYVGLALEALPAAIPLAIDYRMKKKIEADVSDLLSNPEKTKDLAMTTKQQLNLDNQYSTFHYFDGIFTKRAKEVAKSTLDRLEEKKRGEILNKPYPTLGKEDSTISTEPEIKVILPREITQE